MQEGRESKRKNEKGLKGKFAFALGKKLRTVAEKVSEDFKWLKTLFVHASVRKFILEAMVPTYVINCLSKLPFLLVRSGGTEGGKGRRNGKLFYTCIRINPGVVQFLSFRLYINNNNNNSEFLLLFFLRHSYTRARTRVVFFLFFLKG